MAATSAGQPIRVTSPGEYNALAFQGIKVWTCYRQIRDMLEQRFGDAFMLCFARPVENPGNGDIDWHSPVQGTAQPVTALSEEQRNKALAHLRAMALEINAVAEELVHSSDPLKTTRGNILKRSLSYPDETCIYVIGEQPVITAWGFGPGTPGVEGLNLTRIAAPARNANAGQKSSNNDIPPKAAASSAAAGGFGWLWWLLPLLALLLLLFLLFCSIGPVPPTAGKEIFHLDGKPFMEELPANNPDSLRAVLQDLEKKAKAHIGQCRPDATPAPVKAPAKPAAKPNMLEIPRNAENLEFLSGRWLCETGLASTRTGEPVKVLFSFDGKGKGEAKIIEQNDQCDGLASANLAGSTLHIELQELKCRNKNISYGQTVINCQNSASSQTLCAGQNHDGTRWDATFIKLR